MAAALRNVLRRDFRPRRVVEYKKPTVIRVTRPERIQDHLRGVVALLAVEIRQAHAVPEGDQRISKRVFLLRANPPYKGVFLSEAVTVLCGDFRFAYATQPENRRRGLAEQHLGATGQAFSERSQLGGSP